MNEQTYDAGMSMASTMSLAEALQVLRVANRDAARLRAEPSDDHEPDSQALRGIAALSLFRALMAEVAIAYNVDLERFLLMPAADLLAAIKQANRSAGHA